MGLDEGTAAVAAYLRGALDLESAAAELVRIWRDHGWGWYVEPTAMSANNRVAAEALQHRVNELIEGELARERRRPSSSDGTA